MDEVVDLLLLNAEAAGFPCSHLSEIQLWIHLHLGSIYGMMLFLTKLASLQRMWTLRKEADTCKVDQISRETYELSSCLRHGSVSMSLLH